MNEYQLDNYLYKLEREGKIKVIREDQLEEFAEDYIKPPIKIMAEEHAEKLTCRICGRQYVSSGKHDPGFCPDCLREMDEENAMLIGGPQDGEKAHP